MPLSTKGWLQLKWQQIRLFVMPTSEDTTTPLDQVSRFYQSDAYKSLDHSVTSAFFDGPLGGLDQRVLSRTEDAVLPLAVSLWKQGRNISCIVYGEKGTGLSTYLNVFTAHLKKVDQSYKSLSLEHRLTDVESVISTLSKTFNIESPPDNLDTFIATINAIPATVIVIDNAHFLVQRTLNAQVILDALSAIVLGSRGHHLWVMGCEQQAWRRLCYGYQFQDIFSHEYYISNYNDAQLKELLIKRISYAGITKVNGIALTDLNNEKSPLNAIVKKSRGCIELGIFYCLSTLNSGMSKDELFFSPPLEIDSGSFKQLSQLDLFTLAEIATHGQLTPSEHHVIFRISLNQSKMILEHLRVIGLLDQNDDANPRDAYALKLIISAIVIRYLISMNYLY
ncbi:MAG: hypothetical protein ACI843_000561 [Psychrobacter glaciei]|jgi:hypothetical protein